MLSSVVLVVVAAAARVLARLVGGMSLESTKLADFLCLEARDGDTAASSADASRDDGCRRSVIDDLRRSEEGWIVRFRLAEELVEEGDDMKMSRDCDITKVRRTVLFCSVLFTGSFSLWWMMMVKMMVRKDG